MNVIHYDGVNGGLRALMVSELLRAFYFDRGTPRRIAPLDYYVLRFSVREMALSVGSELAPAPNGGVMFMDVEFLPH